MDQVEFHYELTGTGWSECRLRIGNTTCEVTASYLSDALGDLASAVEDVLRGYTDAQATFAEEPGEYRWRLFSVETDRVRLKIIAYPEWGEWNDESGKIIFEAECDRRAFGRSVAGELRRLLEAHGGEGYRDKWVNHDFPTERLRAIEGLLEGGGA